MRFILWAFLLLTSAPLLYADLDDIQEISPSVKDPVKAGQPAKGEDLNKPDLGKSKNDQIKPVPTLSPLADPAPKANVQSEKTPKANASSKKTEKGQTGDEHDSTAPIQWQAKGFKGTREGQMIELRKDVVVTQGDVKLTADSANVYFDQNKEVNKILASGNVKVARDAALPKDRMTARGNEAIFFNSERKVVLKGKASLIRGGDIVRGKQISYDLNTGWITVDNVEGVVQPGDKKQ